MKRKLFCICMHKTKCQNNKGAANAPVRQLRDPAIFVDGDRTYLLDSVAGPSGIAVAEVTR